MAIEHKICDHTWMDAGIRHYCRMPEGHRPGSRTVHECPCGAVDHTSIDHSRCVLAAATTVAGHTHEGERGWWTFP